MRGGESYSISRSSSEYPRNLELCLGDQSPAAVHVIGRQGILDWRLMESLSSAQCLDVLLSADNRVIICPACP